MGMDPSHIQNLILAGIPDSEVVIEDLRGDGDHYAATITSPSFIGKSRIQQHQMVYHALGGRMGGELHALTIKTIASDR